MQKWIAMMAFAALVALPGAMAAYVSTGDFTDVVGTVSPVPLDAPVYYLNDDGTVWQESNNFDGLQTDPIVDELGNQVAPADTNVDGGAASLGEVPEIGVPAMPEMPGIEAPELPGLPALPTL